MNFRRRKPRQRGFTLIEVVIAMAIMAISFTAILSSQSSSILLTMKTRDMNIAGFLARNLMVESEHLMEGKPFNELNAEEAGEYPDPYQRFKWKREVKEVKFPDLGILNAGSDEAQAAYMTAIGQSITKYLSNSLRELVVTVSWEHGGGEQTVMLSTYLVDLNAKFEFAI